ncbi:uncharacterized protein FOMMEDRAFT_168326 [Fomitiporia mediterranea MF3/22]|uniref:uncharacterized protein n=1 Tax=Fomitiporia mediterranea (strain MF3/22) TaxID=694068 RepID=UPI0004407D9B|nr:uncharacterized protein FOMMEDRAFT_168326 [Fomitiporia mediterranea MF3/22]EJD03339.1 hypothetical protein FOMMEDRAFT_168326 [Fomitiporia mediterranea MF3/22]
MTNIVPEQVKPDNARDHEEEELQILREKAVKALQSVPCYFSRLPVELQKEMFSVVIDCSNAKTLALTHVCRSWRDLIVGTSRFWQNLTITPRTELKKADTWLGRSKGTLTDLHIVGVLSRGYQSRFFRNAASTIWSSLDTLAITTPSEDIFSALPLTAANKLRLRKLEVYSEKLSIESLKALTKMDSSRIRHFTLKTTCEVIQITGFTFTSLTTLILSASHSDGGLFLLLKQNPMLENLILESPSTAAPYHSEGVEDLELGNLIRLELVKSVHTHICLKRIRFPNLKTLVVTNYIGVGTPVLIDEQELTHLEHLTLSTFIHYHTPSLISILQRATALKTLEIPRCFFQYGGENTVVEALAEGSMCPKLQHLDLSGYRTLKAGPVIRLVEAHLSRAANVTSSDGHVDQPLPILSLSLDDCPMISSNQLARLRGMVPHVSWRMPKLGVRV